MKPIQAYQSIFLNILKLTLAVGTLGFIGYKLIYAYDIGELWADYQPTFTVLSVCMLLIVFLLMPLNWYVEAQKWKVIMGKHEPVTNVKAYKSILTAITLGIITPNQIGTLAGKVLYLDSLPKMQGAAASFLGEIAQTIATLLVGSYGSLALYLYIKQVPFATQGIYFLLLTVFNIGLTFLFLNISQLQKLIQWHKIRSYIQVATDYTKRNLTSLLLLSVSRFVIFCFQYYLLLYFFGIELTLAEWAMSIFSIFIVQSFAPSFIAIQIGVRGALALFFIGMFTSNTVGILLAAYSLWIINMMIPGLVGLYFLLTYKWRS